MSGTTTAEARPRAAGGGANRWVVLFVLCVSLLLVALDATVLHVAVPAVTEDLRPSSTALLWIVDAYPLVCASLLILFGTLGDRVGRRRVLLAGYALFGVASAVAALADTPAVLIAARVLLGVGGAMIMPATLSLLRAVFPDRRERATAIGIWTAVAAIGAATGPVLGGFLVEHFWWGSVFLINIPLMALILPAGRWLLPESRGDGDGPWDVLGALMAAAGVLGVVLGVKRTGAGDPVLSAATLGPLLAGAVLLVLFVRRQRRHAHPLIDMRLFSRAAFTTSVGCIVLAMLALVGLELIAVQYLQLVLGLSPLETGLRLLPLTFAAMAAGATGSYTLARLGPRRMVSGGFVLTAGSVLLLVLMGQHDRPLLLTAGFVLLGFGLQTTLFAAYESMLSEAPAHSAGGAAAIGETSYQLGAGMGIALLGSVMNAAYAPGLTGVPGVPAEAGRAAANSLGEAYQVAARLGGAAGDALYHAARHAFVHGLHVTLVVSAALLLAGAAMALRLPRVMDPQTADGDGDETTGPAGGGPGGADGRDRGAGRRGEDRPGGAGRSGPGGLTVPVPREAHDPRGAHGAPDAGGGPGAAPKALRCAPAEPAGSGRAAH
ncbi:MULTISPECIES: MFS transporter [Streptomyces]|uniref:Methyl viologen resistance protein SmvA n=2 Tax=Streptomyces TaxID=1883 RepID=A0A1D8FY97_9ACTN|nr:MULTISPECIES: MFS transporter [Streptomyces]AOT58169.1 Methyl viologen resistance protein SmvA [Streptomyces rubrolavendulae]KAF0646537.1 transporter [Streptomyces fradiae ATCC 10745 = DSM 40063]KAF0650352.1 transporter [Streptomyces fradiae ATCC 10745 = DSM 40063]OSY54128.1 Methyl viologen resistance protein SmvA [Streptomyces fradiae ATCC 10745 = DSM 40063]QEV11488.1 MFS transporter [Streptomyces fradiae ATCC 10745 = DSM 40063]